MHTPFLHTGRKQNNGNGTETIDFHAKWVNFVDAQGNWQFMDVSFRETEEGFVVDKAPYKFIAPKRSTGDILFENNNRYSPEEKRVRYDAPISKIKKFSNVADVEGVITDEGILYAGAFPELNADLLLQTHEQEARYLIKFNSAPAGDGDVEVPFTQRCEEVAPKSLRGKKAVLTTNAVVDGGMEFARDDFRVITVREARVWDSTGKGQDIQIIGRMQGKTFRGKKVIPREFLQNATYPVYSDATDTYLPSTGNSAGTPIDAYFEDINNTANGISWASLRNEPGADVQATATLVSLVVKGGTGGASNYEGMSRLIFHFNTSGLPDGATITSAYLQLKVGGKHIDGSDQWETVVVGSTHNPPVAASGYAIGNYVMSAYSDKRTFASQSVGNTYQWTFNATGIAAINKTGITKLGVITDEDLNNGGTHNQGGRLTSQISYYQADQTGTTDDPVFSVTYATESSSVSPSVSPSSSASPSVSPSASISPSSSSSRSVSPSASRSPSSSASPSRSPSASRSPSSSASPSRSPSASVSPSSSVSPSRSPSSSASSSVSSSASPSVSPSASVSPSSSESASVSPSSSLSASPSEGYEGYTRGNYEALPTTDDDLETPYSGQDYIDVSADDEDSVGQSGTSEYLLHQFKNFFGAASGADVLWKGQSTLAPSVSGVFLQVYNYDTDEWDTLDSDTASAADTDFTLSGFVDDPVYIGPSDVVTCRVYQLAT